MPRALCLLCVLALAACAGGSQSGAVPPADNTQADAASRSIMSTTGSTTWTIQAGASTVDQAVQDLDFYADSITVNVGDNVQFRVASAEPHTVAFLAPGQTPPPPTSPQAQQPSGGTFINGTTFSNSGILTGGQTYTVKFVKAGTFKFYCLLHQPEMHGTVIVQNAGSAYPHTQQFYLHEGAEDEWADLAAGVNSIKSFPYTPFGTTMAAGIAPGLSAGKPSESTVSRFLNSGNTGTLATSGNLTVKAGTTITWVNQSNNAPHTVTLPIAGQPLQPMSPFSPPSGGTTYDGSHLVNSGPFFPGQKFSLKFTKAGTFKYYCLFHDDQGMEGTITVKS